MSARNLRGDSAIERVALQAAKAARRSAVNQVVLLRARALDVPERLVERPRS